MYKCKYWQKGIPKKSGSIFSMEDKHGKLNQEAPNS